MLLEMEGVDKSDKSEPVGMVRIGQDRSEMVWSLQFRTCLDLFWQVWTNKNKLGNIGKGRTSQIKPGPDWPYFYLKLINLV